MDGRLRCAQIVRICPATTGITAAAVVAIAVISHDFADGFDTYTVTSLCGSNRRRARTLLASDAVAPVTGAAITLAFTIPRHIPGLYLGFFAGILLYLATSGIPRGARQPSHPPHAHLHHHRRGFMWPLIGLAS